MRSDLRLRSRRFSSFPGRSRPDVPGMCPTATAADEHLDCLQRLRRPHRRQPRRADRPGVPASPRLRPGPHGRVLRRCRILPRPALPSTPQAVQVVGRLVLRCTSYGVSHGPDALGSGLLLRMLSVESFTSSSSSIFWLTVALVIIAIVAGGIAFATWRSGIIRKRLLLSITSRSRLLAAPKSMRDDLEISYKNEALRGDPYVTAIELANVGKSPIKSDDFDRQRALLFSLDVPIIKVLATEHEPASAPSPTITASNDEFELKPELIAREEVIKVALLTEGRPGKLDTKFKPFGDVDIEIRDREAWIAQRSRRRTVVGFAGAVALLALTVLVSILGFIANVQANRNLALSQQTIVYSACSNLLQETQGTALTIQTTITSIEISKVGNAFSFTPSYEKFVGDARTQVKNLFDAYNLAKNSGISLGNTVSIRPQVTHAMTILERLPKDKTAVLLNDVKNLEKVVDLLSCSQAIPSACPYR